MDIENKKRNTFFSTIKYEQDPEREILIRSQQAIKNSKNDKEVISKIIEKLDYKQIIKLKELYEKDIERLNVKINSNKRKMLSIKSEW